MDRVKRIWYLSPMRAAKVQASLRIRAVSPEPPLLAHTSSESRGTFRQKARSLAPLNGWTCAVKICHDGMLEDTSAHVVSQYTIVCFFSHLCRNPFTKLKRLSTRNLCKVSFLFYQYCTESKIEPPHNKTNKMVCATSEDSDQPEHPSSPIRVFAVRMKKVWVFSYTFSPQRRL